MTIIEMRKKRSETWEKAKNFLDTHRNASGILSAEDTATYERMEQEIVDLGHEIERQERLESMEREMQKATSQPIRNTPETKPDENGEFEIVLNHLSTFKEATGHKGKVRSYTAEAIRAMTVTGGKNASKYNESVCFLDTYLDICKQ